MASQFSPNLSIEEPASGDYPGAWAAPVNSNMNTIDAALGTIQSISLAAGSVTLSTAQTRSAALIFSGALPSNVTVTIPSLSSAPATTISGRFFTVENQCSNSSAFIVTLKSTVAGQQVICIPPYEVTDVLLEGTNSSQAGSVKFRNLGRVGSFWDYAGSSVPAWNDGCTVPPYLNCDGTTFSSATYPALATILGGTTLPDSKGRVRATLNQGTSRLLSSNGGVNGNTNLSAGGVDATTLSSLNIPPVPVTDPTHTHTIGTFSNANLTVGVTPVLTTGSGSISGAATTGITAGSTSPTSFTNMPPAYVGGITLIRAA